MWRGEGGGVGGGGGGGWGGGGGGGGGARVDIESIHHDVGTIVCRRDLDRQRMGTVGQPILPEDGHLVSLDRITLAQLDRPHKNAVDINVGTSPGAGLFAADPAHRGPREAEGEGRARLIGCGRAAFGPHSVGVVIPVRWSVRRAGGLADRRIVFLVTSSWRHHFECVHYDPGSVRSSVSWAGSRNLQRVVCIGQPGGREHHRLKLGGRRVRVHLDGCAAVHLHKGDAAVRAAIADPVDRRPAERQGGGLTRRIGFLGGYW